MGGGGGRVENQTGGKEGCLLEWGPGFIGGGGGSKWSFYG